MKKRYNRNQKIEKKDGYQVITDRIIKLMESGVVPWNKPWAGSRNGPKNLVSKKGYQGINCFMLACTPYTSQYFVTYKQAKDKGGNVKRGEEGYPVVFWKINQYKDGKKSDGTDKIKTIPFLRYSTVFNLEQCEGIEEPTREDEKQHEFKPVKHAEAIVKGFIGKPEIKHNEQRAYYSPTMDFVNMPEKDSFVNPESYYCTLFHELAHSTGHKTRLNRDDFHGVHFFGDAVYSKEELVAEFSACFLTSEAGIVTGKLMNQSASYISGWVRKLRSDKKILVQASALAMKATNKILNIKQEVN